MRFLATATIICLAATALLAQAPEVPDRSAIFYGFPSLVNQSATVADAALVFAAYDRVALGGGLEDPGHPDHANVTAIIAAAPNTEFYGYVPLGQLPSSFALTIAEIQTRIAQWAVIGAAGIFLDEGGYDFGVTRPSCRTMRWMRCMHGGCRHG